MHTLNIKASHAFSGFYPQVMLVLFFIFIGTDCVEAKSNEPGITENKATSLDAEIDKKPGVINGKIYVVDGTVIHNLENKSLEIVHIKQKLINKKGCKNNKKGKKKKESLEVKIENKTKANDFQFLGTKKSSSAFYEMGNGIKSVIPTSVSLLKVTLSKDHVNEKSIFFLSNYTASKKLQIPYYLFVAKPSFYLTAMAVRPPPKFLIK